MLTKLPLSAFLPNPALKISKRSIANVKHVILISSGKGGVGKSTTAVNLAISLAQRNLKIGILDADIFGPSIPTLLGLKSKSLELSENSYFIPLLNHGIQAISMGFLTDLNSPIIWRGAMVQKAIQQLLHNVKWNENTDILIVDMPPGTGDIQLTISQQINISGSIIISTPQDLALIDANKGLKMFEKLNISIIGLIQNMSLFRCPNCHHESKIFGEKKNTYFADIPLLGEIPLDSSISDLSDKGIPIVAKNPNSIQANAYHSISEKIWTFLQNEKLQ